MRTVSIGGYTLKYEGGRLGREYDFATGEFGPVPTVADLRRVLREWIADNGECYYQNG